jgi:hypothetical protein
MMAKGPAGVGLVELCVTLPCILVHSRESSVNQLGGAAVAARSPGEETLP